MDSNNNIMFLSKEIELCYSPMITGRDICNTDDTLDSQAVIALQTEIEEEIEELGEPVALDEENTTYWELKEELEKLNSFIDDMSGTPDWAYGEQLIHENYFTEYAEETGKDCSSVSSDEFDKWPLSLIDWDHAAEELMHDYIEADWDGQTYYARA